MTTAIQTNVELNFGFDLPAAEAAPVTETAPVEAPRRAKRIAKAENAVPAKPVEETKAPDKSKKAKPPAPVLTVPKVRPIVHRDRTDEIWKDLVLNVSEGLYEVSDRGSAKERGVIGLVDQMGSEVEARVPLDQIRVIFRVQYVSDMQATEPLVLATIYRIYFDGPHFFARLSESQFNALDLMLSKAVTRSYTYHDLADGKRGYTFDHQDFPGLDEQNRYLASVSGRQVERKREHEPEPEQRIDTPAPAEERTED